MTALISLLAIGSITYWVQRFSAERSFSASALPVEATALIDPGNVARMLGAKNPTAVMQASLASRFVLRGVVASSADGSAALISVDGKPAQTVRVGGTVAENLVLQSVVGRTAILGAEKSGFSIIALEMPALKN